MSNKYFLGLAIGIAILFWILLNVLDQLLFFWPAPMFYLPSEELFSFIVSSLTSAVIGVVIAMNAFYLVNSNRLNASVLPGTTFAVARCACPGSSSIGLSLVSTLGSAGAIGLAFFAQYQELLRLVSLGILCWSLFSISRQIARVVLVKQ